MPSNKDTPRKRPAGRSHIATFTEEQVAARRASRKEPTILTVQEARLITAERGFICHPCGTPQGYRRHVAAGERADDYCKWAGALDRAKRNHAKAVLAGKATGEFDEENYVWQRRQLDVVIHGTTGAYQRHYSLGEEACFKCKVANAKHQEEYRLAREAAGNPVGYTNKNRYPDKES